MQNQPYCVWCNVRGHKPSPECYPAFEAKQKNTQLSRLWQAVKENTTGDAFWLGEILLTTIERETGFDGSSQLPQQERL